MMKLLALFGAVLALAVGCAALDGPSAADLALSEAALAAARDAGAAELAPDELHLATDKIALARRWIAARDYEPAGWLVEQARVDAELAAMKAISAKAARRAAEDVAQFRVRRGS